MCASTMQAQAAKSQLGTFQFQARGQADLFGERVIFPLQKICLGRLSPETGQREYLWGQFGLVPAWVSEKQKGPQFGRNTYNARSETVFEKPSFQAAILKRRAVVPVTTFFEFPDQEAPLRHRLRISKKDGAAFWLAAIWEQSPAYRLTSCSLLTSEPMQLLASQHSRSPVILDDSQLEAWLSPKLEQREGIAPFLKPHDSDDFVLVAEDWNSKQQKQQLDFNF